MMKTQQRLGMNQSIISINIIFKGNISALQNNPFSLDAPLDPSF